MAWLKTSAGAVAIVAVSFGLYVNFVAELPSVPHHIIQGIIAGVCMLPPSLGSDRLPIQEGSCRYNVWASILKVLAPAAQPFDKQTNEESVIAMRKDLQNLGGLFPKPRWCKAAPAIGLDDIDTTDYAEYGRLGSSMWVHADEVDNTTAPTLIHFHGGGYMMGPAELFQYFACQWSRRLGARVLIAQYKLAPEHPMPAPVESSLSVYSALLQQGVPNNKILFMGDSAGGGMSLLLMQRIAEKQVAQPAGAILISPWATTAFDKVGPSLIENDGRDVGANMAAVKFVARAAAGYPDDEKFKQMAESPVMSPFFGNFSGVPPVLISAGEADVLRDSQRALKDRMQQHGVSVDYTERKGMFHCYSVFMGMYPEADEEISGPVRDFFQKALTKVEACSRSPCAPESRS